MDHNYKEIILVRLGEIALKGLNRYKFEQKLMSNLRWRLKNYPGLKIYQDQSRIWIEDKDADRLAASEEILADISKVFGFVSASPARRFQADRDELFAQVEAYIDELWADGQHHSFKFETKRVNKNFPMKSYDLNSQLGAMVLSKYPDKSKVDVHQPEFIIRLEIREDAYIYHRIVKSVKGLPVGTSGKGLLLLSGGIDSPVAGYMMSSRGMELEAIYFHTFPYTSEQAKEKVIDLARLLARYSGRIKLHIVDFTDIQLTLNDHCPAHMLTIVMRRMMMRIAEGVAGKNDLKCLVTGESLGQVASQTVEALALTDQVSDLPVFRPLIAIDKDETIRLARQIGTYDTSILPYEDCCTIFVAKHPKIKPTHKDAIKAEQTLDIDKLVAEGLEKIETVICR